MSATIITCSVTGGGDTTGRNHNVPVTPQDIAHSALEAAKAGAAIVHLHVRDPETKLQSMDLGLYRETVVIIRDSDTEVILNLTTGPGAVFIPSREDPRVPAAGTNIARADKRVEHVLELKPDICSLDIGTMNFYDRPYLAPPEMIRDMAEMIRDAGVMPELECFDSGHIRFGHELIEKGFVVGTPLFQLVLGVPWNAWATPASLVYLSSTLPKECQWAAFGVSQTALPMAAQAYLLGGHVRIGLEDTLYLKKGVLAESNAALVSRLKGMIDLMGGQVADVTEARKILGLKSKP